jgi:hypothetical protein
VRYVPPVRRCFSGCAFGLRSASRFISRSGSSLTTRAGQKIVSVVDADSFGYFEETTLGRIRDGDPATVKLTGYGQLVRGLCQKFAQMPREASYPWSHF